jgi:tRNA (cytidine32/uridine32-2'-O)-methyltransferase
MADGPEKAAQDTRSGPAMAPSAAADKVDAASHFGAGDVARRLARVRIVLINTTHPGNIGATARAMKVMGLSALHLVTPKIYPHAEATARASGADDLLQHARVHDSLEGALQGCRLVLGTSARLRSLPLPLLDARRAAGQALAEAAEGEKSADESGEAAARDVAVLFGRERYGLTNEEMQRCHFLVNIPANPEYSSLNIAQAVQIIAYELRIAALGIADISVDPADWKPVDGVEMERFFDHLERTLLEIKFLNPKQPKRLMARLRRLFNRARPDQNEINILRGILTATQEAAEQDREGS